jgi:gliding motility-associated-like protein
MKKGNYYLVIILVIICGGFSSSTYSSNENNGWRATGENQKVFIENKGQFHTNNPQEKVLYAYDDGLTMIYFTSKGVSYSLSKVLKNKEKEEESEKEKAKEKSSQTLIDWQKHEAEERKVDYKNDIVSYTWDNESPNVQVLPADKADDYHSYNIKQSDGSFKNINYINGYKKLIYKNVYPNIDVEYVFHPKEGIKYSLILHSGADVSQVKMHYSGDLKIKRDGDLHILTLFGDIIDHAPTSFYADNSTEIVSSRFIKNGSAVSIELGAYDHSKTIVVDPWVQTPTMSNSNCVWECEKDGAGNVYIIGGDSPMKLRKYNATGVVQWTYNTPWDTANYWLGTLATDLAGNSYITAGSNAKIQKIDAAGSVVWSNSGGSFDEYWDISFNCDQTKLIVGGTRLNSVFSPSGDGVIFDINTTNGSVSSLKVVGHSRSHTVFGIPVVDVEEVRALTPSRNAKYYFLTLDTIGAIDQNFSACPTGSIFNINHTYSFAYKCEDYRVKGNAGIMSIKANKNFVYTQNGTTIHKRSLATGAILASASIAGGISTATMGVNQTGNSGIDIDSCGNVYVGSGNAVIKYDANLNVLTSSATSFKVYDVAVSYGGNVIVCGATGNASSTGTRTGYVQSFNMSACDPITLICCDATICPAGPFCTSDAPFTLTPATAGGTWSGAGVNVSTGVFSPSVAGPGNHTIIHTLPCGVDSIVIKVTCCGSHINPVGNFCVADAPVTLTAAASGGTWSGTGITSASAGTFSPATAGVGTHTIVYTISNCGSDSVSIVVGACVSLTACQETNGNITVSSGTGPYTWTKDSTYTDCSGCFGGQCIPGFCTGVTGTASATFATGTTITPPGTYPIRVTDATSTSLTITSLASLPACPSNTCPALTVTHSNVVNDSCFGQANGSFSASTTGGVSPWDYTLVKGGTTVASFANVAGVQSFTGLVAGTYILNVLDNNGCPGADTIIITQPSATAVTAAAGPDQSICSNSTVLAGSNPSPGTGLWTVVSGTGTITTPSSPTSGVTGIGVGTTVLQWTVTSPCATPSSDQMTIVNTGGGPTVTVSSKTDVFCYGGNTGHATVSATGGSGNLTYVWTPTGGGSATANHLVAGTYTVTVTDGAGCVAVQTVQIAQPDSISATVSTTPSHCGGINDGSATVTASGGNGNLTYTWGSGGTSATINNIGPGACSVVITDSSGCTKTVTGTVPSIGGPVAGVSSNVTITSGSSTQLTGTGTGIFLWFPPTGLSCDTCRTPTATPSQTTTYCLTVSNNGCSDSACLVVTVDGVTIDCGTVYIPNAFTPFNNDNLNEVFKPTTDCVHDYNFLIFNRWGQKLFETTDTNEGWNGYYKGGACAEGVYIYKIIYTDDTRNDFHQFIGIVTLVR